MKKNLNSIAIVIVTLVASFAATSAFAEDPTQGLCISSFTYEINSPVTDPNPSTYTWGIDDGTSGTDWTMTATEGTSTEVDWKVAGTYRLWSQETNSYGCVGPKGYVTVTVSDRPTATPLSNQICSATQGATRVDVVTLNLADAGATRYAFKSLTRPEGITPAAGNAVLVADQIIESGDFDIIANDAYTNTTNAPLDVVYTFVPFSATCGDIAGEEFTVTVTVYPEVKAPTIKLF